MVYVCLAASITLANPLNRPLGETKVFAAVPFPGYPEGIAVQDGRAYVSGPAAFGVPGNAQPSKIFVYDLHGSALVDTITVQNQASTWPRNPPLQSLRSTSGPSIRRRTRVRSRRSVSPLSIRPRHFY